MQSNKYPGPDGFMLEFYRAFRPSLTAILTALNNDSFKVGCLLPNLNEASINETLRYVEVIDQFPRQMLTLKFYTKF